MAIFDANKKMFLTVNVVLTDPAAVAAAKAAYPEGRIIAPYAPDTRQISAATVYNAPFRGYTQPPAAGAPFTWTPWSGTADQGGPFPLNISNFFRHTGGFFGIGGTTVHYYWVADFILAADPTGVTGNVPIGEQADIPGRRWVEGFELGAVGIVSSGIGVYTPDAARHPGGMGFGFRGGTGFLTCTLNQFTSTYFSPRSWERFYFRTRVLDPAATVLFWKSTGFPAAATGFGLGITASGQIAVYQDPGTGPVLVQTITDPVLTAWTGLVTDDAWHRFDLLVDYVLKTFRVYVDGVLKATVTGSMAGQTRHASSQLGNVTGLVTTLEFDVDDWINSDIPSRHVADAFGTGALPYNNATAYSAGTRVISAGHTYECISASTGNIPPNATFWRELFVENLTGKDFKNGSKVALIRPTGLATAHDAAAWPQEFRRLAQNPLSPTTIPIPESMVSTTSGAVMQITTDSAAVLDNDAGSIGIAAMMVSMLSSRGTTSGTLGYALNGAAAVNTAITQFVSFNTNSVLYTANTTTAVGAEPMFPDITPIELRHVKGADASSSSVYALMAQVEMIGKWTAADYTAAERAAVTSPAQLTTGAHNRPYPRSPWSSSGAAAPISPYITVGGTYVGNGTGQDITFRAPAHFIMIRPVAGTGGLQWLSTGQGSHNANQRQLATQIVDAQEDPTMTPATGVEEGQVQRYRFRVTGANAAVNAIGVTYQYILICDPGMRFMHNIAFAHKTGAGAVTYKLIDPTFTPGFAMLLMESPTTDSGTTIHVKDSTGLAAAALARVNAASVTPALTFGTGEIATDTGLHGVGTYHYAAMLFRKADGNNDTGQPGVVAFGSYIGDGSASRTINITPTSGKRPMYGLVVGSASQNAYQRDPSHTGSNSQQIAGGDVATGITAGGIDQFSVGSSLNTNGVTYTWFILPGDATACNNGWGCNGEKTPVEPTGPVGGPFPPDPTNPDGTPPDPGDPGGGGGPTPDPDDPTPDFDDDCIDATTGIVNRALSRIGISKVLADVGVDNSIEASVARTNWGLDVNQTLRDYHWPFATRYADLVLVAGTSTVAANKDWQYSYRAPSDMVMARRLLGQAYEKRAWDPNPIGFEIGSDSSGALIYTDAYITTGSTTVQLEYTARIVCPGARGDALFRSALTWRHASSLAAALSRDPEKVKFCIAMYERIIRDAETVAAQEQQQPPAGDADWITGRN